MLAEERIANAVEFENAGFTLIPLRGKVPIIEKWSQTAPGTYRAEEFKGNYGVLLSSHDLVIDIDPRNFAPGDAPLKRLIADIGEPLRSLTVRTGGGGGHVYLTKPGDITVVNALKEYPGIEFKSSGRQVVGPGSTHPETLKPYTIHSGSINERMAAPDRLLKLIARPRKLNTGTDIGKNGTAAQSGFTYQDDPATQSRYIEYLERRAQPSIQGKGGDDNAFRVAAVGRDFALSPGLTLELMLEFWNKKCEPPWSQQDLRQKVDHAYKYASKTPGNAHPNNDFDMVTGEAKGESKSAKIRWRMNRNGDLANCFFNLLNLLRDEKSGLGGVFGYNQFTGRVEFLKPAPWHEGRMPERKSVNDHDLKLLKGYLATRFRFERPTGEVEEAITNIAFESKFHPVRSYLDGLNWDGKPRLDTWLSDYCGADDSPYTRACARKVLCAAVMRVMCPGCKWDYVIVLEGGQGIGKSTICSILGGDWAADFAVDPHSRDTVQMMQGKWVIELAELEFNRKAEADAVKAFITRTTDIARFAFGRIPGEFPRQSIIIASKNPGSDGTYLQDDTGNRRWWPIALEPKKGHIDFKGLKNARNQLFAEALVRVRDGEKLYMDDKNLDKAARDEAAKRQTLPSWVEPIAAWIDRQMPTPLFLTGLEIYMGALSGSERMFRTREARQIAASMRAIGWKNAYHRRSQYGTKRLVRGYKPPKSIERKARYERAELETNDPIAEIL